MKAIVAILALIAAANTFALVDPSAVAVPVSAPQDGHCTALILQLALEIPEFINAVRSGDAAKAEQLFADIVSKIQQVIACLQNVKPADAFNAIVSLSVGDRKDCIYRHLRLALQNFEQAFNDLAHGNIPKFEADVELAVSIINDAIKNC